LLDELRSLARTCPNDAAVREQLAMALFNTLYAAEAGDSVRRDALLGELRALARTWPDDDAVGEWLAKGLSILSRRPRTIRVKRGTDSTSHDWS
jgi:hypothetical protein